MKAKLKILFEQHSRTWYGFKSEGVKVELLKWDSENDGPDYILDTRVDVNGLGLQHDRVLLPEDVNDSAAIRRAIEAYDEAWKGLPEGLQ